MVIGDPLLHVQRPVTLPGVAHPNPAHTTTKRMISVLIWGTFILWLFSWATHDPMPDCVYDGMAELCIPPG